MGERPGHGALAELLAEVAAGRFPPADGGVTVLPPPSVRDAGVIGFTAHAVVFCDADPGWLTARLPAWDLSAPLSPAFLHALGEHTGRQAHTLDMLCLAHALPGPPALDLQPGADPSHPRIARALRYRDDVRAWRADGGVVVIGRGVAGRWEAAIEADPARRGSGLGRALAAAARHLLPAGTPLWVQASPANVASVRAFLGAGFKPVGAEAHLTPAGH